jgi:hypothetical protein
MTRKKRISVSRSLRGESGDASRSPPADGASITAEHLCTITGLTDRRHRQLAAQGYFPPPIDGRYQAAKTLIGVIRYQRELILTKDDTLARERAALTTAKREIAQEEVALLRGKYVAKAEIGPKLRNWSLHQRAVLLSFKQQVAPKLPGLTLVEILTLADTWIDEVCAQFNANAHAWLAAPPSQDTPKTPP